MKELLSKKWFIICSSIVLIAIYILLSIQFILKFDWSFCWIFFTGCIFSGLFAYLWSKYNALKIIFINLAMLSFLLGCVELTILLKSSRKSSIKEGEYYKPLSGYKVFDKILGYRPGVNRSDDAKSSLPDGEILFATVYTTNSDGWRVSPEPRIAGKSVLFFGGSFTYGECLKDNETFAWLIGQNTGYKVFNFSFHGYGPHQMLAGIEKGVYTKIIKDTTPVNAIYTAIPSHIERSGGWASWDTYGPEYTIDANGEAQYEGNFNNLISAYFLKALSKSAIYPKFQQAAALNARDYNIKLAVAIVRKTKKLLQEKYPGIRFSVLYWGPSDDFCKALKQAGIEVVMIEDIIPDYFKNIKGYQIKMDHHPNVRCARMVADYLSRKIISRDTKTDKK
jgi:hypothetical protein